MLLDLWERRRDSDTRRQQIALLRVETPEATVAAATHLIANMQAAMAAAPTAGPHP